MSNEIVNVALVVFPEKKNSVQDGTLDLLRKWVNYSPIDKNNMGDEKSDFMSVGEESRASIFSIFSGSTTRATPHAESTIKLSFVLPPGPLMGIPADVSRLIWGYLSPSELATASLVSSKWHTFSQSCLNDEIFSAILTGSAIKKCIPLKTRRTCKPKMIQFNLETFIVTNEVTSNNVYDYLFFIFETPEVSDEVYNTYLECYANLRSNEGIHTTAILLGENDEIWQKDKTHIITREKSLVKAFIVAAQQVDKTRRKNMRKKSCSKTLESFLMYFFMFVGATFPFYIVVAIVVMFSKIAAYCVIAFAGFFGLAVIMYIAMVERRNARKSKEQSPC